MQYTNMRPTHILAGTLLCAGAAVSGGCILQQPKKPVVVAPTAGGGVGKPVTLFPTKQELQSRTPIAVSSEPDIANIVPTETWEIKTKIPTPGASYGTETRWDKLLVEALAGKGIVASPALRCAAEEAARFFTVNAAYPDDHLQEFLVLRCGSSLVNTGYGTLHAVTPAAVPEDRVERELGPALRKMIDQTIATAPSEMGLGYFQSSGRISFVAFAGQNIASLSGTQPQIDQNRVIVSGVLPKDAAYVLGLVTHGSYGFLHCEADRAMLMPHFRVSCPIAEDDTQARIEVLGRGEKEVLWNVGLRLLVQRDPTANLMYQLHRDRNAKPATGTGDYTQRLAAAVNDARRRANRTELQLLEEQSKADQDLTGYLHDAYQARDRTHLQWAVLGMLAGWEVPGTIRDGGIYWFSQSFSTDAEGWVERALENPMGRWVLLDPDKSRLAVGTHPYGKSGTLTLVSTYALFDSLDHHADEDALFKEITALRRARGLGDPQRAARSPVLTDALAKIANHALKTDQAVSELLQRVNASSKQPALVQVIETAGLFQFPAPEVFFRKELALEIGVTHYKAPGGAWGQYVLLFVLHNALGARQQMALAGMPR